MLVFDLPTVNIIINTLSPFTKIVSRTENKDQEFYFK